MKALQEYSHKRYNILTGEWVLVSPHRAKRPWQGQQEEVRNQKRPSYDASCYLCPGNTRANGKVNAHYKDVYVFTNDFSALQLNSPQFQLNEGLLQATSEQGICKVVCFSPDHSKTLADLSTDEIVKVIGVWQEEYQNLGAQTSINYVQIFENKGAVMGCSNPHPHGQIWSNSSIPNEVEKKQQEQKRYYRQQNSSLLGDYIAQEIELNERVLYQNKHMVVLIPFWAVWPFEAMIIPKQHKENMALINEHERHDFAEAIAKLTKAYDRIFKCSFPYSSGIHQAPTDEKQHDYWHWHMSFYPPLLRSASVKKFMVGYEMFGSPQRDITAEQAAHQIKNLI